MATNEALPVAAVVLKYNEEKNIEACLRNVAGWCRELFVVDSGGTANLWVRFSAVG